MIDRAGRDTAIRTIEAYLSDDISAFEFDFRLKEIESDDFTLNEIIHAMWFHYDDCTDHFVNLSKAKWDYFQRLLLILHSDGEMETEVKHIWHLDHAIAWFAVVGFLWALVSVVQSSLQAALLLFPLTLLSMSISKWRNWRESHKRDEGGADIHCCPFSSSSQIRWLRKQVSGFRKQQYRKGIDSREIVRSRARTHLGWILGALYWTAFSPLVLLFQGIPTPIIGDPTFVTRKAAA